jgi:hypothetical protein
MAGRTAHCCFCFEAVDLEDDSGLTLVVARPGPELNGATQQMFCHVACLGQRLHPSVPFDGLAFFE